MITVFRMLLIWACVQVPTVSPWLTIKPRVDREFRRELLEEFDPVATPFWRSNDGNWNAAGSWSTGVIPGAGDTTIFDGGSQVDVISGHTSGVAAIADLITYDAYTGDIGAPGSLLQADVTNKIIHRGQGSLFFEFENAGVSDDVQIIISSPNLIDAATVNLGLSKAFVSILRGRMIVTGISNDSVMTVGGGDGRAIADMRVTTFGGGQLARLHVLTLGEVVGSQLAVLDASGAGQCIIAGGFIDVAGISLEQVIVGGTLRVHDPAPNFIPTADAIYVLPGGVLDMSDARWIPTNVTLFPGSMFEPSGSSQPTNLFDLREKIPTF